MHFDAEIGEFIPFFKTFERYSVETYPLLAEEFLYYGEQSINHHQTKKAPQDNDLALQSTKRATKK